MKQILKMLYKVLCREYYLAVVLFLSCFVFLLGPSSISLYGAAKILPYYIKELRFMTESLKSPPIVHFVSEYPQVLYQSASRRQLHKSTIT